MYKQGGAVTDIAPLMVDKVANRVKNRRSVHDVLSSPTWILDVGEGLTLQGLAQFTAR